MKYINNTNVVTITATGIDAAAVITANNAGFYGIFGHNVHAYAGNRAATRIVNAYIAENGIDATGFNLLAARTVNTDGTKTPYKVEIDARIDVA